MINGYVHRTSKSGSKTPPPLILSRTGEEDKIDRKESPAGRHRHFIPFVNPRYEEHLIRKCQLGSDELLLSWVVVVGRGYCLPTIRVDDVIRLLTILH